MDLLKQLQIVSCKGVGLKKDRSLPAAECQYIPLSDNDLKVESQMNYSSIDKLVEQGLVRLSFYKEYGNAVLTYEGRKEQLRLQGWKRSGWRPGGKTCCEKALPTFCVCSWCSVCPDHGRQCHGTHD